MEDITACFYYLGSWGLMMTQIGNYLKGFALSTSMYWAGLFVNTWLNELEVNYEK